MQLKVRRVAKATINHAKTPPITVAQERLARQKMKDELVAKMKRRMAGTATPEDEVEVITEWV